MFDQMAALWRAEAGATAIEYGLIAALICLSVVAVETTIGETLNGWFTTWGACFAPGGCPE